MGWLGQPGVCVSLSRASWLGWQAQEQPHLSVSGPKQPRLVTTTDPVCVWTCCAVLPVHTGALLSLCLLAQVYDHTLDLITRMAALPLGAEVLVQVRAVTVCVQAHVHHWLSLQQPCS